MKPPTKKRTKASARVPAETQTKLRATSEWQALSEERLRRLIQFAQDFSPLAKLGPKGQWIIEVKVVGRAAMTRLNADYRGKNYPTDVLSFPAMSPFWEMGHLGDLVICLPTLQKQARDLGLKAEFELEVLLAHGLLHLLGLDHEKSSKEASRMGRWEAKLLRTSLKLSTTQKLLGLIDRSESGS
jgi:probable rRNA maturation factor